MIPSPVKVTMENDPGTPIPSSLAQLCGLGHLWSLPISGLQFPTLLTEGVGLSY